MFAQRSTDTTTTTTSTSTSNVGRRQDDPFVRIDDPPAAPQVFRVMDFDYVVCDGNITLKEADDYAKELTKAVCPPILTPKNKTKNTSKKQPKPFFPLSEKDWVN